MNEMQIIENQNQRVMLTSQLAESYETTADTITKNFNRNINRYQDGKHYYCLQGDELRQFRANGQIDLSPNLNKLYLWTEKGAMLHAKSLNTDKAWAMYDILVDTYFAVKSQQNTTPMTQAELLLAQAQIIVNIDNKVNSIQETVVILEEKVDKRITIDCGKQRILQNIISNRVYERAGAAFPTSIRENVGKFFQAIYKDLKNRFGVASYRDININHYDNAICYIKAWIEPSEIRESLL